MHHSKDNFANTILRNCYTGHVIANYLCDQICSCYTESRREENAGRTVSDIRYELCCV